MWFALRLHRKGLITKSQVIEAAERWVSYTKPLGKVALECRMLTMKQVAEIFSAQADRQKPFGRIAVELGLLSEPQLAQLLMKQSDRTPSMTDCLVEIGAIDRDLAIEELALARREMTNEPVGVATYVDAV